MFRNKQWICVIVTGLVLVTGQCVIAQDVILGTEGSYYHSTRSAGYPFLSGSSHTTAVFPQDNSFYTSAGLDCGCGLPIIPALAQGLRDTLDCLFPFRGLNRGRGLLFSHRFHGTCCHGCGHGTGGIIYEDESSNEPTPAVPGEIVPSTPAAGLEPLRVPGDYSVQNSGPPGVSTSGVETGSVIRPANFRIPQSARSIGRTAVPENPLRR